MRHEKRAWTSVLPAVLNSGNLLELCNARITRGEGDWGMRVNFGSWFFGFCCHSNGIQNCQSHSKRLKSAYPKKRSGGRCSVSRVSVDMCSLDWL